MASDGQALIGLWFDGQRHDRSVIDSKVYTMDDVPIFHSVRAWLDDYYSFGRPTFLPPLRLVGSPFRRMVADIMLSIPYGKTTTYGEIAKEVAHRMHRDHMSAQAVGNAVGHNPISIIIPCHRVLGTDGRLTGYAGGLDRKKALLTLEQNAISCLL